MTTAEPDAADPYVCEHCDESVPHTHVDEKPLVERYRRDLLIAAVVGALALPLAIVLFVTTFGLLVVAGLAGWVVATAIGVVTAAVVTQRSGVRRGMLTGALVSAAVAPLTTFAVTLVAAQTTAGAVPWACGVAASTGWLAGAATVLAARDLRLRSLLGAHTREGEAARSGVVRSGGSPRPLVELAWTLATAIWFGVCAALVALVPPVVLVLVPLGVALAVLSRRWQATPARAVS